MMAGVGGTRPQLVVFWALEHLFSLSEGEGAPLSSVTTFSLVKCVGLTSAARILALKVVSGHTVTHSSATKDLYQCSMLGTTFLPATISRAIFKPSSKFPWAPM